MKDRRMFNLGDQGQGAGEPPAGPAVPLLDAALYYAGLGWPVFPCEPRGKRPFGALAPHGVKDATCDALVIRAWWRQYPRREHRARLRSSVLGAGRGRRG